MILLGKMPITYLLNNISKTKVILVILLGVVILFYFLYNSIYNLGYNAGVTKISHERDQERIEYNNKITSLKEAYAKKEQYYIDEKTKILIDLNIAKAKYEKDLAYISNSYAHKLHESNSRVEIYRRKAESRSGAEELASYTTKLDRIVTEGIPLVEELTTSIRYYEEYIRQLSMQRNLDITLMDTSNGNK